MFSCAAPARPSRCDRTNLVGSIDLIAKCCSISACVMAPPSECGASSGAGQFRRPQYRARAPVRMPVQRGAAPVLASTKLPLPRLRRDTVGKCKRKASRRSSAPSALRWMALPLLRGLSPLPSPFREGRGRGCPNMGPRCGPPSRPSPQGGGRKKKHRSRWQVGSRPFQSQPPARPSAA